MVRAGDLIFVASGAKGGGGEHMITSASFISFSEGKHSGPVGVLQLRGRHVIRKEKG